METNQVETGKLVVTSRAPFTARRTRAALRRAVFPARITRPGFRSVFVVEAPGGPAELARQVYQDCAQRIGRATAVLAEVESKPESIKEAAVRIGTETIAPKESFCFRLHKRGLHNLPEQTPKIERDIGGAINDAVQAKTGEKPRVDLSDPDLTIEAEVLGPTTLVGILRKEWMPLTPEEEVKPTYSQPQPSAGDATPQIPPAEPAQAVSTKATST
jgi:tRNA(Ser,Leu) C12 N-acetylase TAN1